MGEIATRGLALSFSAKRWCFIQILRSLQWHLSAKN
jgi:hypothetical protein